MLQILCDPPSENWPFLYIPHICFFKEWTVKVSAFYDEWSWTIDSWNSCKFNLCSSYTVNKLQVLDHYPTETGYKVLFTMSWQKPRRGPLVPKLFDKEHIFNLPNKNFITLIEQSFFTVQFIKNPAPDNRGSTPLSNIV